MKIMKNLITEVATNLQNSNEELFSEWCIIAKLTPQTKSKPPPL